MAEENDGVGTAEVVDPTAMDIYYFRYGPVVVWEAQTPIGFAFLGKQHLDVDPALHSTKEKEAVEKGVKVCEYPGDYQ